MYNEADREGIQQLKKRGLAAQEATSARRIKKAGAKMPWQYAILSLLRVEKVLEPMRHGRAVLVLMHSALQAEGPRLVSEVIH